MRWQVEDPGRQAPSGDMDAKAGPESAAVKAALTAWRRKAADILMAASAGVHLPLIVLGAAGYGPALSWRTKAICIVAYVIMVGAALFRRVDYRPRLGAYFIGAYLVVGVANANFLGGAYAQVGLIAQPILALALCGSRAAKAAIIASATILVSGTLLHPLRGVSRSSPYVVWYQAAALAAFLAVLMIVLTRFHRYLLEVLAAQFRAISEVKREMHERYRLEREIAGVADDERRRLSQELHDGVCQQVTAALLRSQVLGRRAKRGGTLSDGDFQALSSLLGEAIGDMRSIARGLCPLDPDPEALAPALRALAKRTQETAEVRCEFTATGDIRIPDTAMAQHLYRIAQEALSNAVRHAKAARISIELSGNANELLLQIEDDGVGLPAELPTGGMGMRTMAYRAKILGGELTIAPASPGGTCVICRIGGAAGAPSSPDHSGDQRWIPTV